MQNLFNRLFRREKQEEKAVQKPKTPKEKAFDFTKNLLFAAIAALLIKTFFIETSRVPTGSMERTIMVGDFLFVNKFIYGSSSPRNIPFTDITLPYFQLPAIREPHKKDIVVFLYPGDRDELEPARVDNYVKRLVGCPGDTIQVIDKVLYVNGKEFYRPPNIQYLKSYALPKGVPNDAMFPKGCGWNEDNYGPIRIPKKGDRIQLNAQNVEEWRTIIDREFGRHVVSTEGDNVLINGKTVSSYALSKDYFFMMGDNRDDSADSRYWGFVPRDRILGQAFMIYWSWDPSIPFTDIFNLLKTVRLGRIAKLVH